MVSNQRDEYERTCPQCSVEFMADHSARKYCLKCRPAGMTKEQAAPREKQRLCVVCNGPLPDLHPRRKFCTPHCSKQFRKPLEERKPIWSSVSAPYLTDRACEWCGKPFGSLKSQSAKFCDRKCRQAHKRARDGIPRREKVLEKQAYEAPYLRKGSTYTKLVELGLAKRIIENDITATHAAELMGVTVAAVSRSMGAYRSEQAIEMANAQWAMEPEYAEMLPVAAIRNLRLMDPDEPSVLKDVLLSACETAFWAFEHEFITIGSRQESFLVMPFHKEIIAEMMKCFIWGTRLLVLTPPRHGKSELVIRFVAWIIIMYPNIQVLWVAANTDLAGQMTGKLKGIFQYNDKLTKAFLPTGHKFGDEGCKVWRENAFTLYTRTDHTLKAPTFTGLGSTSTVAGRDADFIGVDDLEERKTVATSDLRHKSRVKHAEIMERQEDHTGVVTIASRQHPDDIPNHLLSQEGDDAWKVLIYPAHDEIGCLLDPDEYKAHVDCMLMPTIRPYSWLMKMQSESEALGLPGRFPLRYLQKAVPVEGIIFDIPLIKKECFDRSRGLGMDELPAMRLIAGLDPAPRGVQAAFLWGWTPETLYLIDLEAQEAGGVLGAISVMKRWHALYGLDLWIHEDNSGQIDAWQEVERFQEMKRDLNIIIKTHTTGKNKHDPEFGISSMASWYHSGRINLPVGTGEARRKINMLLRQLELWTADGLARGKTDIKMASWLPFPRIQRWGKEANDIELVLTSDQSYPEMGSNFNSAPWSTNYPGG